MAMIGAYQSESREDIGEKSYRYERYGEYGYGDASGGGLQMFNLRKIARLARVYWRFLGLVALLVLGAGVILTFAVPDRYSAESRVLVLSDQVSPLN